jgi:hypothetical protein
MLLPYTTLTYYGGAAGAMVTAGAGAIEAEIKAQARAGSVSALGVGSMPFAKGTRLVNSPMVVSGSGTMPQALPKARARAASVIRVNALSQDDVTGAVLEAPVEGGLSLKSAIRLLLAHAAGDATGLESSSIAFKSQDGTKTRISGTVTGGNRSIDSIDVT